MKWINWFCPSCPVNIHLLKVNNNNTNKGVNMFKLKHNNTGTTPISVVLVSLLLTLGETKLIFWSTGKTAKNKVGRSVGKIEIILFDS